METVKAFPKWFWLSIVAIVTITIYATWKCNNDKKTTATNVADSLNNPNPGTSSADIFDMIPEISNSLG